MDYAFLSFAKAICFHPNKVVDMIHLKMPKCKLCGSNLSLNKNPIFGRMCIANKHYSLYDTEETLRFHGYYARHSFTNGGWRVYGNINTSKLYPSNDNYRDGNQLLALNEFDYKLFSSLSNDEQDVYIQKLIMLA
jgi:hypothetical protein